MRLVPGQAHCPLPGAFGANRRPVHTRSPRHPAGNHPVIGDPLTGRNPALRRIRRGALGVTLVTGNAVLLGKPEKVVHIDVDVVIGR